MEGSGQDPAKKDNEPVHEQPTRQGIGRVLAKVKEAFRHEDEVGNA